MKIFAKRFPKLRRKLCRLTKGRGRLLSAVLALLLAVVGYNVYMASQRLAVDPKTYTPLLELIASAESRGNYNAYFGNASNSKIRFTEMTVAEVLQWQDEYVADGSPSSAVGRYQFINQTLQGLVESGAVARDDLFNAKTQDQLAMTLLERRGAEAYVNREITTQEFAASLAMEWASLPKVIGDNPEESYYQSHLNAALVSPKAVLKAASHVSAK